MLQYLEPRTDVPAKDDWSTRLALAVTRLRTEDRVTALLMAATLVATLFVPLTVGNRLAMLVLAGSLLTYLPFWLASRRVRRGLLDEPWRRVRAEVAGKQKNGRVDRLLLDGLVLKGKFGTLPDMVLERQEVFVCGPDADGRAVLRAAGSSPMFPAVVDAGEYQAAERVERTLGRPGDEQLVRGQLKANRQLELYQWLMMVFSAAIFWMLIVNSVSPLVPTGLVTAALLAPGLVLLPSSVVVVLRNRTIAKAVASSESWTSVPMALFPWQRGQYVAGIAELPDGPALVRFPRPWIDVVANIADTKVMWIAGTHEDILAVGVLGTNLVTFAEVRPAAQSSGPLPWWHRYRQPDFSALPA